MLRDEEELALDRSERANESGLVLPTQRLRAVEDVGVPLCKRATQCTENLGRLCVCFAKNNRINNFTLN